MSRSSHQLLSIAEQSEKEEVDLSGRADECEKQSQRLHDEAVQLRKTMRSKHSEHERNYFKMLWSMLSKNDPSVTSIGNHGKSDFFTFPKGYGKALGPALKGNTHVSSLQLNFDYLGKIPDKSPLIEFLEKSTSLRHVEMVRSAKNLEGSDSIANAIAANPHIKKLTCCIRQNISPESFQQVMNSTTSIQELVVGKYEPHVYGVPEDEYDTEIASAIGKNTRLTHLAIESGGQSLTRSILLQLNQTSIALCDLQLISADDLDLDVAAPFLSSPSMRHFGIGGLQFGADRMETFVAALQWQRFATTVSKLSFYGCTFDADATQRFVSFMQTPTRNTKGETTYRSSLREIQLISWGNIFPGSHKQTGNVLASMLAVCAGPGEENVDDCPTIGSQVRTLSMGPKWSGYHAEGFSNLIGAMAVHGDGIHLSSLHLFEMSWEDCLAMAKAASNSRRFAM